MSAFLVRVLGRSVLQQRSTVSCCNEILPSASASRVRHLFTPTSLGSNFRTSAFQRCIFRAPRSNHYSILQFTRSTPWNATHLDNRIPRSTGGGRKPSGGSWIDNLPPPFIFWSIVAANAGVFLAWYYAENNYVRLCILREGHPSS